MKPIDRGHQQRSGLLEEHPWGDVGQIIMAVLFFAVWIIDTFFLHYTTFVNAHVPLGLRISIGIVNVLVALYLARTSLRIVYRETRGTPRVIRESVYGIVGHPMYLREILLYAGCLLFSLSLAATGVWVLGIGFLYVIARYEERKLLAHFDEEYRDYMREVPMWLPRMGFTR